MGLLYILMDDRVMCISSEEGKNVLCIKSEATISIHFSMALHVFKHFFLSFKKKFLFIYFARERQREQGRWGERENPKQALCCQCRAQCGA